MEEAKEPEESTVEATTNQEIRFRRRTCVVCEHIEPVKYVTTFARNADKQKEWIKTFSNGDAEFASKLTAKVTNGRRKYLCLDHFSKKDVRSRKSLDGIEVVRNAKPMPYKNAEFVKHHHLLGLSGSSENLTSLTSKRMEKLSSDAANGPMKMLIDTVNFYVERMENEQK